MGSGDQAGAPVLRVENRDAAQKSSEVERRCQPCRATTYDDAILNVRSRCRANACSRLPLSFGRQAPVFLDSSRQTRPEYAPNLRGRPARFAALALVGAFVWRAWYHLALSSSLCGSRM